MKKLNKKRVPIAEAPDGTLYVDVKYLMHPLVAMIDGLPLTFFGDDRKRPYLAIDRAIAWCQAEMRIHSREKYEGIVAFLNKAKLAKIEDRVYA